MPVWLVAPAVSACTAAWASAAAWAALSWPSADVRPAPLIPTVMPSSPGVGTATSDAALPNKACTALSPSPWARANWARLAMSGRGASVVMTLSLLPSLSTCKSSAAAGDVARACRSSFSICPFNTPANAAPEWLPSGPVGVANTSFPLGDWAGVVKKFIAGCMGVSIFKQATECGNAMCNARNVTGKGLPQLTVLCSHPQPVA